MPARETILLLAGTAEGAHLAERIAAERAGDRLIVSLAGRTRAPHRTAGEMRVGGFGGAAGLAAFLRAEGVTRLLDATHPFAHGISRGAAEAAAATGVPRLAFLRPPWVREDGDRWTEVDCLAGAAVALPAGAVAFLALGRQHLSPFARRPDVRFVLRMVDPPAEPLPFAASLVLGKPPADREAEAALLAQHGVTHLVARNSGGDASRAKIEAARRLRVPVVMLRRMAAPPPPVVDTQEAVMAWLAAPA